MQALLLILFLLFPFTAVSQIGWTLAQCRKHFGHELWMEDAGPAFGIKYHHYTLEENLERDAPAFSFDGLLLTVSFDSDGTVGKIWWRKSGEWSDQEIQQLLKSSSAVSWRPDRRLGNWQIFYSDNDSEEQSQRPSHWVGVHNGVILFDAIREFSEMGGGHDNLTVTTRQLY
jgi:hypothetical protein